MTTDATPTDLPTRRAAALPLGLRLMRHMLGGVRIGTLDVTWPDGSHDRFGSPEASGLHGVLQIHNAALIRHVLRNGEVGFGEAYLDGCWDSPDLAGLLQVMYLNEPHYRGPFEKNRLGRFMAWIGHRLKANTRRGARRNIEHHYDLGNDFYALWLDETMAYSAGMFTQPGDTLEDAQRHKFQLMAQRLDLRPEHTLLEIGSGWGGFALHAARQSGCRVHSITLSKEQLAEARRRAAVAGLSDRVTFELCDYRDLRGQYDRVVSIEMYEAVGEAYWPGYFTAIAQALKPGGVAALQGITIHPERFEPYRRKRDFIQKYIFPGGMLCPPGRFQELAAQADLHPVDPRFYALDYAETLACWDRNVLVSRDAIVEKFGERFLRLWRYYLAYCECGFRTGSIDLMQITLRKPA